MEQNRIGGVAAPERVHQEYPLRNVGHDGRGEREQDPISLESVEDRVGVVEVARKLFRHGEIRVRGPARFGPECLFRGGLVPSRSWRSR